ncbi:MAG: serine/threonine-protein kinase [Myxococcota bacterium]
MQHLEPGSAIDRYVVEDVVGSGAMAVVYRVRHRDLGTVHALKVLGIVSETVRARMLQEGRIQGSLRHPNVVAVTDVVSVGGNPALVMEYVEGPSLASWLGRAAPTLAQIDAIGRDVLRGLAAAHRQGLVHRDLKPANVLMATVDDGVVAKVADFGLAKVLAEDGTSTTRSGVTMGTPAYMAPEQFRSAKDVDARADVFAVGVTLYELATGRPAIDGADFIACYNAAADGTWKRVREIAPEVPERLAAAIEAAMTPDPAKRPADADALLRLWQGEEGEPLVPGRVWHTDDRERILSMAPRAAPALSQPTREWSPSLARDPRPTPTAAPVPASQVGLVVAGGAGFFTAAALGVGALALAGIGAWVAFREPAAEPVAVAAPAVEAPPVAVTPSPAPEAEPAVEAAAVAQPTPAPAPRPAAKPAVAPEPETRSAAVVAPASPAPVADNVKIQGVDRAWLQAPSGATFQPGVVPPGDYTVYAFFDPASPTKSVNLTIEAGKRYVIQCNASQRVCKPKES